ncbi:MAG: UBP-type zinc finger domain-containing protein [Balneolaceae bacterium]
MACEHKHMVEITEPKTDIVCRDCLSSGDSWVHLRMCMTCGYIGCCDSSKNKHARKHFYRNEHPIIRSVEPGESWQYCYIDNKMLRL